ncbi:MAG: hypothetical protein KGJ57_18280 [Sphingomonadales bacterium]|nr:hypothetical protein [Sphingomonadales bacterium]MDE2171347.1 hypothetical protein [Sphingomonadales bacterium]
MEISAAIALFKRFWPAFAALGVIAAFGIWLAVHDRKVIANHEEVVEAAAATARDAAAGQRVQDAVINTRNEQDLHHAIDTAPTGGALSPAAHALACERLRQLGRVSTACGSAGGSGSQAGSR